MTRKLIVQNIMNNYSRYGITEGMVHEVIDRGLEYGMNYDMIYLDMKRRISGIVGEEFLCTPEDMAKAMEVPIEEIYRLIEEGRKELLVNGENPDEYFPVVPVAKYTI